MKRMVINAPILFKDENQKQDEEIRCLLEKQFAHNEEVILYLHDGQGVYNQFVHVNTLDEIIGCFFIMANREPATLTYDDLEKANDTARYIFEPEGGIYGVKFQGQLKSIWHRSLLPNIGQDYPFTIIERAVFLWHEIATRQCFFNGNKRTALLVALMTLELNGYELDLSCEHMYEISMKLANQELDRAGLYALIFDKSSLILITSKSQLYLYEEMKRHDYP